MASPITITGKFLGAMATQSFGTNGFQVRKFYMDLTTNPEFPNTPEFQLTGNNVGLVDNIPKGQMIQVRLDIEGRKVKNQTTGKDMVITNLRVWKIDIIQMQSAVSRAAVAPPPPQPAPVPAARTAPVQSPVPAGFAHLNDTDDDLPF